MQRLSRIELRKKIREPFPHRQYPHSIVAFTLLLIALSFILLLLIGCSQNQLVDKKLEGGENLVTPPERSPPVINSTQTIRPEIPRTVNTDNETDTSDVPDRSNFSGEGATTNREFNKQSISHFLNPELSLQRAPGIIIVGDSLHPLLLNMTLSEVIPLLQRGDLAMLSTKKPTIDSITLRSEPFIRFDFGENSTGRLTYERDQETDEVTPELFFEEGKPIFELAYLLYDGAFPLLEGEIINLFGVRYFVEEANNMSITLTNEDHTVLLANNTALSIDGRHIADTKVNVDPWSIIIRYYTPNTDIGGIRLHPGESLRSKLRVPESLLNPHFDVRFDGWIDNPDDLWGEELLRNLSRQKKDSDMMTDKETIKTIKRFINTTSNSIRFIGNSDKGMVYLEAPIFEGTLNIILVSKNRTTGNIMWGEPNAKLHVKECDSGKYCINAGEEFIMTSSNSITHVMEFLGAGLGDARFRDMITKETHIVKLVEKRPGNHTFLEGTFDFDDLFRISVKNGAEPTLTVDMNGDGSMNGAKMSIITPEAEIVFNDDHSIDIVEPRFETLKEGRIGVSFPEYKVATNITLTQVGDTDTWRGATPRGTLIELRDSETIDGLKGDQLIVKPSFISRTGVVSIFG